MKLGFVLILGLCALAAVPSTAGADSAPASPIEAQPLSNERTLTYSANPIGPAPIYAQPRADSPRVARLHAHTEEGFPEVYLLLASIRDGEGKEWIRLRIPGRPNGRTGWTPRAALGVFHRTRWQLLINRRKRRLTAYYNGHRRFSAPVGVGKPSTPTPPGNFWIRERFHVRSRASPYWPWALGTSDYSPLTEWPGGGVVGIHGDWGAPQLIPGAPSHGCVRMHAADISWLAPRIPVGTPVHIK
jgi:hypothetical protein